MDWDVLSILQSGDKTMAWLGALALAAGGTAIVVAAYIQIQRLRVRIVRRKRSQTRRKTRSATAYAPVAESPAALPIQPTAATPPPAVGVAAYRAEQARTESSPAPDHLESPSLDNLDSLLRRLRNAAESLEAVALKSGRAAGSSETYQAFLTGLDVEYLHRQN